MPRVDREFLRKVRGEMAERANDERPQAWAESQGIDFAAVVAQMESDVAMAAEVDTGILTMLCAAWQQGYETRRAQEGLKIIDLTVAEEERRENEAAFPEDKS